MVALSTRHVAKPWGRNILPKPFAASSSQRIGEIWFEPTPRLDSLLIKYIFTSEALSVQVHPSDRDTLAGGLGRQGKDECWLVVDAEPSAVLGIGFARAVDRDEMRAASLDGSIETLIRWRRVRAGDFFYIPAGTVHAIGAGVGLIEVQQNSDITYRLYDYGRPRELHLDQGLAVARGVQHDRSLHQHVGEFDSRPLVEGPLFRLDLIHGAPDAVTAARYADRPLLVLPREGGVCIRGESVVAGECGLADSLDDIAFESPSVCLIAQPCAN